MREMSGETTPTNTESRTALPGPLDLLVDASTCPVCGCTAALVAPECADGHGPDCPDRLCLACGLAVFVDPPIVSCAAAPAAQRTA